MYGLLGEHLTHSFSPQIHSELGNDDYRLFEISPKKLESFMQEHSFEGVNVTIPYKKAVIPYLDVISDEAEKIGAVNTVLLRDGKLYGYNTDYFGFRYMLEKSGIDVKGKKAVILGSGGACATVRAVLRDCGARDIAVVGRNGENNYNNLYLHFDGDVIVNTTPVGMYPNNMQSLVNLDDFKNLSGVLDVVYNPLKTKLILDAEERNVPCLSGLSMLVAQAKKAHEIFFDTTVDTSICEKIEKNLYLRMCNIVLVGMAGCGKSTVGKMLADKLEKEFVDTDGMIEKSENMTIPQIFEVKGENFFRQCETSAITLVGKEKSRIIATGGGVVTREENYKPLAQNGIIIFINRNADLLTTDGRPLSQKYGVKALYEKRMPLYRRFAHIEINGDGTVEEVTDRIIKEIKAL